MSEGLRPCPFCGHEAKAKGMKKGGRRVAYVQCRVCNARSAVYEGEVDEVYADLAREAAAAWNRRAIHRGKNADAVEPVVYCLHCKHDRDPEACPAAGWRFEMEPYNFCSYGEREDEAMRRIDADATPTVDAVPVIRCKDCDSRVYMNMGGGVGVVGGCALWKTALPEDFYCANGKRGEG